MPISKKTYIVILMAIVIAGIGIGAVFAASFTPFLIAAALVAALVSMLKYMHPTGYMIPHGIVTAAFVTAAISLITGFIFAQPDTTFLQGTLLALFFGYQTYNMLKATIMHNF